MIVERTLYVPKAGQYEAVLAVRRRACAVRRAIGLKPGAIGRVTTEDGTILVQWECAFKDTEAHAADLAARDASTAFAAVRSAMRDVIDGFDRQVIAHEPLEASVLRPALMDGEPVRPVEVRYPSDGRELAAFLFTPPGDGPFPLLITNHGSSIAQGTQDLCRPSVAALLLSWGIASLLPHRRGYGNSPGTPWREDVHAPYGTPEYDAQLAARLDAESDDVVAARAYAEALPQVDRNHIGVMGSSFGGTVTLLAAAKDPSFRCAVEFAGAAMNWDRTPGLRALMHDAASKLTQPIFFLQAENDYSIRPTLELAEGLAGTERIVRSHVFPQHGLSNDEGHFLYRDGTLIWGPAVREFLEECL